MSRKSISTAAWILAVTLVSLVAAVEAQAEVSLDAIGGPGGSGFTQPCPPGQHLTGFDLRVGDWVDALRPVCAISYGPATTGTPTGFGEWHGGDGGGLSQLLCPPAAPIVLGIRVWAEGQNVVSVHGIYLFCGLASTTQAPVSTPSAIFEGQPVPEPGFLEKFKESFREEQSCPAGQVAVGVHGRSGIWLDAMGLICDAPRLPPPVVATPKEPTIEAKGRVKVDAPTTADTRSICDMARQARARNSPAAPGLEAKCKAAGEGQPARTAKVVLGVEVFDAPGGAGKKIGILNAGTVVGLFGCQQDNWCHVHSNNVPNGDGWVYNGPDYRSLQI